MNIYIYLFIYLFTYIYLYPRYKWLVICLLHTNRDAMHIQVYKGLVLIRRFPWPQRAQAQNTFPMNTLAGKKT